ncbi:MAG: pilus assembly protein PilP [Deltaproteobacteria bacterium]|nr:pilus assembly protein PilP [Deltaproteobacteria bacterium]
MRRLHPHFIQVIQFLVFGSVLAFSFELRAAEDLEIELLQARLESLQENLAAKSPPEILGKLRLDVEVVIGETERRLLVGLELWRREVCLQGSAASVLDWVNRAVSLRYAPTPAMRADWQGRRLRLCLHLWSLNPGRHDHGASKEELRKLEANLLWLGGQLDPGAKASLGLLSRMLESELVFVERLEWSKGLIKPKGFALDQAVRSSWVNSLGAVLKTLPHPPRLHAKAVWVQALPEKLAPLGLHAKDLDVATAMLAAAKLAGRDLVAALPRDLQHLDGHLPAQRPADLIPLVAERLGLQAKEEDRVWVVAQALDGKPGFGLPRSTANRPLNLRVKAMEASLLWTLATAGSGVRWLAASTPFSMTVVLRERSAKQVTSLLAWAQGLRLAFFAEDRLMVPVPLARPREVAVSNSKTDKASLAVAGAPVGMLLLPLLEQDALLCTGAERKIQGLSGPVGLGILRQALMATADLELVSGPQGKATLRPRAGQSKSCKASVPVLVSEKATKPGPSLGAILRKGPRSSRALLREESAWHWLGKGDRLADGRKLRAVSAHGLLLDDGHGGRQRLGPEQKTEVRVRSFDPAQFSLARLRLAGTIHSVGGQALALVEDPLGQIHFVDMGDMIGRRCGKVIGMTPGKLVVQMDCPSPGEPKRVELILRGR